MDVMEMINEHKIAFLAGTLTLLILLMLAAVLLLIHEQKDSPADSNEIMINIEPSIFMLPEEPLELPLVQYSRKQKKIWSEDDLQYWYTIPNKKEMQKLHEINEETIKQLWESVP